MSSADFSRALASLSASPESIALLIRLSALVNAFSTRSRYLVVDDDHHRRRVRREVFVELDAELLFLVSLDQVAEHRTEAGADGGGRQQRRSEQPDDEADLAADHGGAAGDAVALGEHVHLPVCVAAHDDGGFDGEVRALQAPQDLEVVSGRRRIGVGAHVQGKILGCHVHRS